MSASPPPSRIVGRPVLGHMVSHGEGFRGCVNTTGTWASQDNDSNFHMDFVAAAASLRAQNYGIPPANRNQVTVPLGAQAWRWGSNPSPTPQAQTKSVLGRASELWARLSQPLLPPQQLWRAWWAWSCTKWWAGHGPSVPFATATCIWLKTASTAGCLAPQPTRR